MKIQLLLAAIALVAIVAGDIADTVSIDSVSPTKSHFKGKDLITITGIGFSRFSQAQCFWDGKWAAFDADIIDDFTVVCETPAITLSSFSALPHIAHLDVVFDGNSEYTFHALDDFVFGPELTTFFPSTGVIAGGTRFTVKGQRFNDFTSAAIFFDGVACLSTAIKNDTDIVCDTPPGSFNQDAMVTVVFDKQQTTLLHFESTFHYGPQITIITPPCSNYAGGSTVTLLGNNFNDAVLASSVPPTSALPVIEIVYNNKRYYGSSVSFDGSQIIFTTPFIDDSVFGEDVEIYVHFKGINSKVAPLATPYKLRYGPIVYNTAFPTPFLVNASSFSNPTPNSGHRAGGDIIAIDGCGFSAFTTGQISPLLSVSPSPREFCVRGPNGPGGAQDTLVLSTCGTGCERILCYSAPFDCDPSDSANELQVEFRVPSGRFSGTYNLPPPEEDELSFKLGPVVSSVDRTRGSWIGGETATVTGKNFLSNGLVSTPANPGWDVTVTFTGPDDIIATAPVTIVSDTKMTFTVPSYFFAAQTTFQFDFDSTCTDLPRTPLNYFFGPSCSSISPANDYLTGGRPVTISGVGFVEDGSSPSSISIRLCIDRMNPDGDCLRYQEVTPTSATNNAIVFTTPLLTEGISTLVGGNRIFGDIAEVYVYYDDIDSSDVIGGGDAVLFCENYVFGPVVGSISPQKGPMGPRAAGSPGTPVTLTGTAFNDPAYNKNIRVAIGNQGSVIFQNNSKVDGFTDQQKNTRITFSTVWGGTSNSDNSVVTVFDTCNTTTSNFKVTWGPAIHSIVGPSGIAPNPIGNSNLDVYGLLPAGGQSITVSGSGFGEYFFTVGEGDIGIAARCLIDGVEVSIDVDENENIICTTPARSFRSVANLTIEFGHICDDSDLPYDYFQVVTASQLLYYTPRIISFTPDYGLTSGGTDVTVTGEGFSGWDNYICYFDHYTNGINAENSIDGTQVSCQTPYHRGDFNTDVTMHILLSADELDLKTWAPVPFHYGPICTAVSPNNDAVQGGIAANLIGDGFIDCSDSGPNSPFENCTFVEIEIAFNYTDPKTHKVSGVFTNNTGVTDTTVGFFVPPGPKCSALPSVYLYFPDAVVSDEAKRYVTCSGDTPFFHYGPIVTDLDSEFIRQNTAYGWTDTQVTIFGANLADPSLSQPACMFGNLTGTFVSSNDDQVICSAPENNWDALVNITLNYGSNCTASELLAGFFHYGPVIDAITPNYGVVGGDTPVVISGFAFSCCGIDQYECLFPDNAPAANFSYPTTVNGDSVTCNVPENDAVDVQINNVGVRFGSPNFPQLNVTFHTLTEAKTVLTYYYGPIVTSVSPTTSSLSGRGDGITISGGGFTDPYFDNGIFCDYFSLTAGFNTSTFISTYTDDEIVCTVAETTHRCGDVDQIRPRWTRSNSLHQLRPEQGVNYFKTANLFNPPVLNRLPYFNDGGSTRATFYGPIRFGPNILSLTPDSNDDTISDVTASSLRVYTSGSSASVVVSLDNIQDWISDSDTFDYGFQNAICVFGNRFADVSELTLGSNDIECRIPQGAFGDSGTLSVILDPKIQFSTVLAPGLTTTWWHWLPYANAVSKKFASPSGYETVVVSGAGFCAYDSVICVFGNTHAVQSDIADDYHVVCQTPPAAPASTPISLIFCSEQDCTAVTQTLNTIAVTDKFNIAGITDLSPREGPRCGGTNLTISGSGFTLFESITCRFLEGQYSTPATVVSDTVLNCLTPDTTPDDDTNPVSCIDVSIVGHFPVTGDVILRSPFNFEAGFPLVYASDPTSAWIETKTEVVVIGEYFDSLATNDAGSGYQCIFGDLDPIAAQLFHFTEDDEEIKTAIVCDTPTIFDNSELTVGTVPLEIVFFCDDSKSTANRLPFTFFQKPDIDDFNPKEGPEVGGTLVTVTGEHLAGGSRYFCSFGTLGIDNQVVSATYDSVQNTISCYSPSNIVTTTVDVDFAISVDDANTFVRAELPFSYQNVVRVCDENDAPGTNPGPAIVPINSSSILAPSFLLTLLFSFLLRLF